MDRAPPRPGVGPLRQPLPCSRCLDLGPRHAPALDARRERHVSRKAAIRHHRAPRGDADGGAAPCLHKGFEDRGAFQDDRQRAIVGRTGPARRTTGGVTRFLRTRPEQISHGRGQEVDWDCPPPSAGRPVMARETARWIGVRPATPALPPCANRKGVTRCPWPPDATNRPRWPPRRCRISAACPSRMRSSPPP